MAFGLALATRQTRLDAATALLNSGGAGSIQIRSGTRPASADDTASGTLLATIELAADAFGDADAAATATMQGTPITVQGVADGTATWARFLSGGGDTVMDCSVGASGSGADLTLNTTTISTGVDVTLNSGTLTEPES